MATFRHPVFAKLAPKIARAEKEMGEIDNFLAGQKNVHEDPMWGTLAALSLGVHNIYNGIEDILLSLAKDIDNSVPSGASMHQDLLDQMSAEIATIRQPVLDVNLFEQLTELKGFRHVVRHRYGFDLKPDKVMEHVARVREVLPAFTSAIVALEAKLLAVPADENDGGDGSGGGASGGPR